MDDRDTSVMEARWLLAVPVSLMLTVLLPVSGLRDWSAARSFVRDARRTIGRAC